MDSTKTSLGCLKKYNPQDLFNFKEELFGLEEPKTQVLMGIAMDLPYAGNVMNFLTINKPKPEYIVWNLIHIYIIHSSNACPCIAVIMYYLF